MPFAVLNGARLWYDDWNVNGEPLIFLHGFTGCRQNWGYAPGGSAHRLASNYKKRYRCIFLESRGIGESEHVGPYTIAQQAVDVLALADFLRLDSFTFCGHSMGGAVGWQLLATAPSRLRKAVLMAPVSSKGYPQISTVFQESRTHVLQHYGFPKYTDRHEALERVLVMSGNRTCETHNWASHRAEQLVQVNNDYWKDGWLEVIGFRIPRPLDEIKTPVLLIAGGSDSMLRDNIADCMGLQDGLLHVCSVSGHEVAVHDPQGVAAAIHAFMVGEAKSFNAYRMCVEQCLRDRGHVVPPKSKY